VKKYCRAGQATDDNMAHAHCMLDNEGYKYTHSGCVMLIAFPLQQWLHERASMLRYACIAFLVFSLHTQFHPDSAWKMSSKTCMKLTSDECTAGHS
jgi:hypothetical protein